MDKNAIKKYAVWARNELIARVTQRALKYGITAADPGDSSAKSIGDILLSDAEVKQRAALISEIRNKGFEQVMEEVAYTWFNRFAALRFMEVNGYLPSHVRVFTDDNNAFKPQILSEAIHLELDGLDMDKVYEMKNENRTEELFQYLLIVQCNALNSILPGMFQKIEDYTELLLPDYLLREGSVIERLIAEIPEDNFDVGTEKGQIEIIGWLYQYYISEKHEEVVDPLHGKVVKKEEVPAATQLFTTDWVVRYLIDNSVGRYWIERNPDSTLADKLTYFVKPKDGVIKTVDDKVTPQEISTFDPCVGSGHFLIYAFDVLMKIYVEYGYSERDAATEIVKNNLFGLDIDGRATQLAYFSVMMKARQYDRRFFSRGIQPHIYEIMESNTADKTSIEHFYGDDATLKKDVEALLDVLRDVKEYGSILQMPAVDFGRINERFEQLKGEISMYNTYLFGDFQSLIRPAELMSRKYAIVATNPPYLNKYDEKLKKFISTYYKDYAGDLFSIFMYRNFAYCLANGYTGFMTPNVWMFIKSYENLRTYLVEQKHISSLIQMAKGAFYKDATVDVCAFVLGNYKCSEEGIFIRLEEFKGDMDVQKKRYLDSLEFSNCSYIYFKKVSDFIGIEGIPFAYWISEKTKKVFENPTLRSVASPCIGMRTGDNDRFLRFWFEVSFAKTGIGLESAVDAKNSGLKWFPYNKGGAYRRWYGNNERVVNWENDGEEIKAETRKRYPMLGENLGWKISNEKYYFSTSITWSDTTSAAFSGRYSDCGALFDVKGSSCFPDSNSILYVLGLLNTKITQEIIHILNPTITTQVGDMARIPVIIDDSIKTLVEDLSRENIKDARLDWDSYETSWDFKKHPFVRQEKSIKEAFEQWKQECGQRFYAVKKNEEQLNKYFIELYGLSDELTNNVPNENITMRVADLKYDIKSFISYAVGCMMGRYSLDSEGLAYAGGVWDVNKYKTFVPDKDAILPICDDEYFEDDIVTRFVKFVEVVYSKGTLEENLQFIADALGGKGASRDIIRSYFVNEFFTDHLKTYQKRPIYWLFDSGKKNSFKCLVYMHRYKPDTIARIRTDYVHEMQSRYRTAIADIEKRAETASTGEKVKLTKQLTKIQGQSEELLKYEEKIHHLADQMISIDLDDGVKHNYAIFQDVLAKIK